MNAVDYRLTCITPGRRLLKSGPDPDELQPCWCHLEGLELEKPSDDHDEVVNQAPASTRPETKKTEHRNT